ncbi:DUF3369 domain-containing protein [Aliagarivorans taiwanensis]|uniref:DUF3369 domain-containing protein n=1 Tax=Aliagarivorans taiwanensis TaxID=561966 RepID=UPI000414B136|nr:DUF3369 domain-containing protein [Aliagarivorans taiwanensis]
MSDLVFIDDIDTPSQQKDLPTWKLLIVDDEQEVHSVTRLVLSDVEIDGYAIEFISAYSAEEARKAFDEHQDIAIALIDVVMETEHAGLELIRWIRETMQNHATRLILRTGQPGQAPEESVIKNYDINDYKSKTELTATKLKTITYSAIRSYRDILFIERHRAGLVKVIESTSLVLKSKTLYHFGSAVLKQLVELFQLDSSAMYITTLTEDVLRNQSFNVLAATGDLVVKQHEDCDIDNSQQVPDDVRVHLKQCLAERRSIITSSCYVGYYPTDSRSISLLYVEHKKPLDDIEKGLLEVFAANIALTFENLTIKEDIQETQKELIFIIGDAIEQRSKETGSHVKRVALICELMAKKLGFDNEYVEAIKHAAPLHDLGKIAIPESILHKPGKLDADEWGTMKTHAQVGHDLLAGSNKIIAKLGADISLYHHEKWDGSGYPKGLAGEDIPIAGRIMAITDVFDALGAKRSYKEPWSYDEIKNFIVEQRGKHFDPQLVDILLDNYQDFIDIRERFPD